MSAFDKVIGYETIKNELQQICDMIHNQEVYTTLGAKMPQGVLLYGDPGLGKTLMAKCFIAESGLKSYTVRKNKGSDDFVGEITDTFRKAKEDAPAIIFLDDMDKFANEDSNHRDAEEYVAVQSGIDDIKGAAIFVFATANDIDKLPDSLKRSGRFDRKIEVCCPSSDDAVEIIKYYLKDKKVSADINLEDIAMMINYSSCAELETILNEAAIRAAFLRKEYIAMEDLVGAVLRMEYEAPDTYAKPSTEDVYRVALHEAGHLVISEVMCPGSIGLVSLRTSGRDSTGGFTRRCKEVKFRPYHVLVPLGGKAAVELYHAENNDSGCQTDLYNAVKHIRGDISDNGTCGLGMLDLETRYSYKMSESFRARNEAVVYAELERYMCKAREILLKNREFLEKAVDALLKKETLLYSDIKMLRGSVTITEVVV